MDEFRLIHKQSSLKLERTYATVMEDLLPEWCAENDVECDPDSQTGTWAGRNTTFLYEWNYEPDPDGDGGILTQRIRMPEGFIWRSLIEKTLIPLVFLITYIFQGADIGAIRESPFANTDFFSLSAFMLIFLFGIGVWIVYRKYKQLDWVTVPDPLVNGQNKGYEFNNYNPNEFDSVLMFLTFILVMAAVLIGNQSVTLVLGTIMTLLTFQYLIVYYLDGGKIYINILSDVFGNKIGLSNTPRQFLKASIQFTYVMLAVLAALILLPEFYEIILDDVSKYFNFLSQIPVSFPYVDIFFAASLGYYIFGVIRNIGGENRIISYNLFQTYEYTVISRLIDAVSILLGTTILYTSIVFGIWILTGVELIDFPLNTLGLQKSLTTISISLLYFPIGFCYQFYKMHNHTKDLINNSIQKDISVEEFERQYRLLDTEKEFACSLSNLRREEIIVSKGLKQLLSDDDELAAVIAHEEAHINYRDNLILRLTAYLSIILLCGKNVLYTLIDFERRELRADSYAATKVGSKHIRNALKKLRDESDPDMSYESYGPNFAPQMNPMENDQGVVDAFKLFFGDFAIANSHSSFDERISNIDDSENA